MTVVADLGNSKTYMITSNTRIVDDTEEETLSESTEAATPKEIKEIEQKENIQTKEENKHVEDILGLILEDSIIRKSPINNTKNRVRTTLIEGWELDTTFKEVLNDVKKHSANILDQNTLKKLNV